MRAFPTSWCAFDLPGKEQELAELEPRSTQIDFWDDNRAAQAVMARISALHEQTDAWRDLAHQIDELWEMFELAEAEGDEELAGEVDKRRAELDTCIEDREFELLLSGQYDHHNAILAVHAGTGGVDSQDWTQMLLRMYLRWAEEHKYKAELVDESEGEEAGIKSATVEISGKDVYGYLKGERGVHRLVRLSPYDAAHRRHTSFALVEVMPEIADEAAIEIDPKDLRIDTYRSQGAGGQHVNKTESAIRITHLPTGIVVTCQNERSQGQNKDVAMRVLRSKLVERRLEEQAEEQARIKGEHHAADFGNAARSYVLHPYNLVKDNRSGYETSNANAVLDGDLDGFIQSYLKSTIGA